MKSYLSGYLPVRMQSLCNQSFLVAFLCCHVAFLDFSVSVGAFVIGLRQISSFSPIMYMFKKIEKIQKLFERGIKTHKNITAEWKNEFSIISVYSSPKRGTEPGVRKKRFLNMKYLMHCHFVTKTIVTQRVSMLCGHILNKKRKVSFWWCNLSQFSLKVDIWGMKYC